MKIKNKDLTLYIKKTMLTLFREERLKRGETLEQTARKINIPLYELDFLECGKNCLSWKTMSMKVANLLSWMLHYVQHDGRSLRLPRYVILEPR